MGGGSRGRGRGSGRGRGLPGGAYVPPSRNNSSFNHESTQVEVKVEPQFDLDSLDDFSIFINTGINNLIIFIQLVSKQYYLIMSSNQSFLTETPETTPTQPNQQQRRKLDVVALVGNLDMIRGLVNYLKKLEEGHKQASLEGEIIAARYQQRIARSASSTYR